MKASFVQKLACPMDKQDLALKTITTNTDGDIIEGILTCHHCKRYYPIIHGVPILSPDEYREKALEEPVIRRWEGLLPGRLVEGFLLEGQKSDLG